MTCSSPEMLYSEYFEKWVRPSVRRYVLMSAHYDADSPQQLVIVFFLFFSTVHFSGVNRANNP